MSTISLSYPNVTRDRHVPEIGRILILTGLVLIAVAVLVMVLSIIRVADQAYLIPVAQASPSLLPVAVPVPTPPTADVQPIPSQTPAPSAPEIGQSVVAVPVPTP